MQRYVAPALALALGACGENGQFVGDDLGDNYATPQAGLSSEFGAMPADAASASVSGLVATCRPVGTPSEVSLLGGVGLIDVVQEGVERSACADWLVEALMDPETRRLDVSYLNVSGRACADRCAWTFTYTIEGLQPGAWELLLAGEYATADVQ